MSTLLIRSKLLTVPSGSWPSVWVLLIAATLVSLVGVAGFLTANASVEGSAFLPANRVPWFAESVIEFDMDYALNSNEYNDVVFIGGSATLAGIVTNSLQDTTGLKAFNFGNSIDIGPDGHLEIFRAYLKHHPKPRLLVYPVFPRDLGDKQPSDVYFRDRFIQAYGTVLPSRDARPPRGLKFYFEQGYLWLRLMVQNRGTDPLEVPRGNRPPHREVAPMLTEARGHMDYPQGIVLDLRYMPELQGVPVSPWYDRSFREMAELARDENIPLLIWIMPIPDPTNPIGDELVTAWAQKFQSDYPEVTVEGLPLQTYPRELWGNGFHLNADGAERFTSVVSARVQEILSQKEGS